MSQLRTFAVVCLALTVWTHIAYAQQDSDFILLQGHGAPPNIGILIDDSGSMANAVWAQSSDPNLSFNPKVFWDQGTIATAACTITKFSTTGTVAMPTVPDVTGSTGLCPSNGKGGSICPENDDFYVPSSGNNHGNLIECNKSVFPATTPCNYAPTGWVCTTTSSKIRFTLPEFSKDRTTAPTVTVNTRWARNYVWWLLNRARAGVKIDTPQSDRLETAKTVIKTAIDSINPEAVLAPNDPNAHNKKARFGLYSFKGDDSGSTSSAQGAQAVFGFKGTRNQLFAAIDGLIAIKWTPLGEALTDISRDMSGNNAIGVKADLTQGTIVTPNPMDDAGCAKNFVVLLTDGEPTQDQFGQYTSFSTAIGDYDKDNFDPDPPKHRTGVLPYGNNGSDYLDDVAKFIYDKDLRPKMANGNPEHAGTQNITTYVVGFTINHALLQDTAKKGNGLYFTATSASELDDAMKKTFDDIRSRTSAFSAASIPSTRTNSEDALFTAFFEPSSQQAFWPGHLQSYEIFELPANDPNIPDDLEGNLAVRGKTGALAADVETGEFFEPRDKYFWDAAVCLSDATSVCYNTSRTIYNNKGTPAARMLFDPNLLTAADLGILGTELASYPNDPNTHLAFATNEKLADYVINYVRGEDAFDADADNNITERRPTVLGDIFHSNPLAIGGTSFFLANEKGFGPINGNDPNGTAGPVSFYDLFYKRQRVVYAGANDGGLHAFKAGLFVNPDNKPLTGDEKYHITTTGGKEGQEMWAYVMKESLLRLKDLVKLPVNKPYFVDGSPAAADAWLPSAAGDLVKDPNDWTTVMVTGMRNGGDSYLALDITDPNALTAGDHSPYPKLLWECCDPNEFLGRTWSNAIITRVKVKGGVSGDFCGVADNDGNGDCVETWVAIFSGGYRENGDPALTNKYVSSPTDPNWTPDARSIYIVNLKTGKVLARAAYNAVDAQLKFMTFAIPSSPAVADLNQDGFADILYVGDLGGQLWKWDLSAVGTPDTNGVVPLSQWPIGRYFTAPVPSNLHRREIFYPPSLSLINNVLTIAFGTGERTLLEYPAVVGTDDNQFYVMRDLNPTGSAAFASAPHTISELTLLADTDDKDKNANDLGFYVVAERDQKFVTESLAFAGFVVTLSYDPEINVSLPVCEQGGDSILHIFSLADGAGFFTDAGQKGKEARRVKVGSGLPTSPRISQMAGKSTGAGSVKIVIQTSMGRLVSHDGPANIEPPVQQLFWRQM